MVGRRDGCVGRAELDARGVQVGTVWTGLCGLERLMGLVGALDSMFRSSFVVSIQACGVKTALEQRRYLEGNQNAPDAPSSRLRQLSLLSSFVFSLLQIPSSRFLLFHDLRTRRQCYPVLFLAGEWNTQLEQLDDDVSELVEENLIILGIPLHVLLKLLILDQRHIRRQHHQTLAPRILELLRSIPLPKTPLLAQQQPIVIIAHHSRAETPRSLKATAIGVAAAEGVGAAKGNDFAVVEAHAAEDGAKVLLFFGAVGEATVRGAHADVPVLATRAPGDGGALHFLDGADAGEGPEVGVGDPGEFFWDERSAW